MKFRRRIVALIAVLSMSAGCGESQEEGPGDSVSKESVNQRIDELISQAVTAMQPEPHLTPMGGGIKPCLDPTDGGSEDRVTLTKNYWLDDVPKDRSTAKKLAQHVYRAWRANGHLVDAAPNWEDPVPTANMRSVPDDFLMQVIISTDGSVNVGVTSPCFWDKSPDDLKAPAPKSLGRPAPKTKQELHERQQYLSGVQSVSSVLLESLSGGWPSQCEESGPYVSVGDDGTLSGRHEWTYTCEDANVAADTMNSLRSRLADRGWTTFEPDEQAELERVPEERRAELAEVLRSSQGLMCQDTTREGAQALVELYHGHAVLLIRSLWT